VNATNVKRCNQ